MISPEKILICRRDNIGDLVLTTPLIGAIVSAHPLARVDILVNSYTQEVIDPFPGVQHVYAYTKIKHAAGLANKWRAFKDRISLYWSLRQQKYDWLVLVDSAQKQKNKLLVGAVRPRMVLLSMTIYLTSKMARTRIWLCRMDFKAYLANMSADGFWPC